MYRYNHYYHYVLYFTCDQERDKHKNSKFKRHIMVIKISKHIKLLQDEGRFKIRRMHEDGVLLAALYYKMKHP